MLGVGIYNIISLVAFENFSRNVYVTGGVLFAIIGVAKIVLSMIGFIGWGTGYKKLMVVVSHRIYMSSDQPVNII